MLDFEKTCSNIRHKVCERCMSVGLRLKIGRSGLCESCVSNDPDYLASSNALPVWYDDENNVHYELPSELVDLTVAEKLLIQLVSVCSCLRNLQLRSSIH